MLIFRLSLVTNRQSVQVNAGRPIGLRHFAGAGSQTIPQVMSSIQNRQDGVRKNFLRAEFPRVHHGAAANLTEA